MVAGNGAVSNPGQLIGEEYPICVAHYYNFLVKFCSSLTTVLRKEKKNQGGHVPSNILGTFRHSEFQSNSWWACPQIQILLLQNPKSKLPNTGISIYKQEIYSDGS